MQTASTKHLKTHRVTLSPLEICLLLGETAESLEEGNQGYTAIDLQTLVDLHARLLHVLDPAEPSDYAVDARGAVVIAHNPSCVIAWPLIDDLEDEDQTSEAAND